MRVTILRGIPGSGKTTLAKEMAGESGAVILSADDYFVGEDGVYRFDAAKLGAAHNQCLRRCLYMLEIGNRDVVVDNTNIRAYEYSPYYRLAETFGATVEIVTIECPLELALKRQTHGVPRDKLKVMWGWFCEEWVPPWWKHRVVDAKS